MAQRLLPDLATVDPDDVSTPPTNVLSSPRRAVDRHAAGLDQLVGAAARRDAGAGEVGVQAHPAILSGYPPAPCATTPT